MKSATDTRGGKRKGAGRSPAAYKKVSIPDRIKVKIELAQQSNVELLLMPEEACLILGYRNKRQVLSMIADKQIKAINLKKKGELNNQWRIRYTDLMTFIQTRAKN